MGNVYFTAKTFRFQRDLAKNNNRAWFAANRQRYEEVLRQPFLRLIADLQAPLAKISAHYRADPRPQGGSLFRIHRDTRFANDKTPYKTWAGARIAHERRREVPAPSFYVHIAPRDAFAGGGLWHPESPTLNRVRTFLADNPAAWTKATRAPTFRRDFEWWGESLTRPPRGFDPAHPLIEDIKRRDFAAGARLDDAIVTSDELLPAVVERFKRIAPVIDYLCAALELEF